MVKTPLERFIAKIEVTNGGCWEWTASKVHDGYGWFNKGGRNVRAHRWSYEQFVGPIPSGLTIDHLCRNRACVNPSHLEAVSVRENLLRGNTLQSANAKKTHCPQGHPYDRVNTRYKKRGNGLARICRTCEADQQRRRMAKKPHPGHKKGEDARTAKLTWTIVREIRQRHAAGEMCTTLAAEFGVTPPTVQMIVKRRTWKETQDGKQGRSQGSRPGGRGRVGGRTGEGRGREVATGGREGDTREG